MPVPALSEQVERNILLIRGHRVMLDTDLAKLYGIPTKRLNEQVQRNKKRFPSDFIFQLTPEEVERLRSQIATLKPGRGQHRKNQPYAFTEQVMAMLSSVLHSERAIQVNIAIMRAFVQLREMISSNKGLARRLNELANRTTTVSTCAFCKHEGWSDGCFPILPSILDSLSWKGTQVGLRAAVERGPSECARSGSTGPAWTSLTSRPSSR